MAGNGGEYQNVLVRSINQLNLDENGGVNNMGEDGMNLNNCDMELPMDAADAVVAREGPKGNYST